MKVECNCNQVNAEKVLDLSLGLQGGLTYNQITVGERYEVLSITAHSLSQYYGSQPSIEIIDDNGSLSSIPLFLFNIIDPSPSSHWKLSCERDGTLKLWPEEFYEPYFHDDLSNGYKNALDGLRSVIERFGLS